MKTISTCANLVRSDFGCFFRDAFYVPLAVKCEDDSYCHEDLMCCPDGTCIHDLDLCGEESFGLIVVVKAPQLSSTGNRDCRLQAFAAAEHVLPTSDGNL